MKKIYLLSLIIVLLLGFKQTQAQIDNTCDTPVAIDLLDRNLVSTFLGPGGTFWDQGYFFPNTSPFSVSAIYAGGLWVGGFDAAGNLKLAAQTYGSLGNTDFFAGPLDPTTGLTAEEDCEKWDKVFGVTKDEIEAFLADFEDNDQLDNDHFTILGWPGRGNTSFSTVHFFDLPDQELAPFVDTDNDGIYNPNNGDYPAIKGDEALWWVMNDAGGIHQSSQGDVLQFEFQVMAYAAASTEPAINNTTFYEMKIINRSPESRDSTFISLWMDPDLGCYTDDYVGSLPEGDFAFVYNADDIDGESNCSCPQSINTYCQDIPVLGVKILDSPKLENGEPSGMTSFAAYNNGSVGANPPGTLDPNTALEYYRLMTGRWRDGSPFTVGGDGYQSSTTETNYLFSDSPNDTLGWSMCTAGLENNDVRIIMSTGGVRMDPGAIVNFSFAVTMVQSVAHPCPDIAPLTDACEIIEEYFENGTITSTDFVDISTQVTAFPNPAFEHVELQLKAAGEEIGAITLYDTQGRIIHQYSDLNGQQFTVQKQSLSAGIYFYQLQTQQGKIANGKIVFY